MRRPWYFSTLARTAFLFYFDAGETVGSGSSEAAHPSLSLHIRTICTGTFKCVTPSMQSGCHAVSSCYTSVESANLLPHMHMLPSGAFMRNVSCHIIIFPRTVLETRGIVWLGDIMSSLTNVSSGFLSHEVTSSLSLFFLCCEADFVS